MKLNLGDKNFGQVYNAFIRIINIADNQEICRYDLTEDYSIETAMIFVSYIVIMESGNSGGRSRL